MVNRVQGLAVVPDERNDQLLLAKLVILSKVNQNKSDTSGNIHSYLPDSKDLKGIQVFEIFRYQVLLSQKSKESYQY